MTIETNKRRLWSRILRKLATSDLLMILHRMLTAFPLIALAGFVCLTAAAWIDFGRAPVPYIDENGRWYFSLPGRAFLMGSLFTLFSFPFWAIIGATIAYDPHRKSRMKRTAALYILGCLLLFGALNTSITAWLLD